MVVDDEAAVLLLVDISLQRRGFKVLGANGPFAALSMLDNATPDLFIIDNMMPGMNGAELCQVIRARPETAKTPIIIFSGSVDRGMIDRGAVTGANAYLPKGSTQELMACVEKMLA
jgi:CheY-like chemotaxis protein